MSNQSNVCPTCGNAGYVMGPTPSGSYFRCPHDFHNGTGRKSEQTHERWPTCDHKHEVGPCPVDPTPVTDLAVKRMVDSIVADSLIIQAYIQNGVYEQEELSQHKARAKQAIERLITQARISELEWLSVYAVQSDSTLYDHLVSRIAELKGKTSE